MMCVNGSMDIPFDFDNKNGIASYPYDATRKSMVDLISASR
jgi:hypothetical protein